jgi:hypothetical protein
MASNEIGKPVDTRPSKIGWTNNYVSEVVITFSVASMVWLEPAMVKQAEKVLEKTQYNRNCYLCGAMEEGWTQLEIAEDINTITNSDHDTAKLLESDFPKAQAFMPTWLEFRPKKDTVKPLENIGQDAVN